MKNAAYNLEQFRGFARRVAAFPQSFRLNLFARVYYIFPALIRGCVIFKTSGNFDGVYDIAGTNILCRLRKTEHNNNSRRKVKFQNILEYKKFNI